MHKVFLQLFNSIIINNFLEVFNLPEKRGFSKSKKRDNEARFRAIFENTFDAVLLTIPNGAVLSANAAAQRMFEMSEDEIKRAGRKGLVVMDDVAIRAVKERQLMGKAHAELTFKRKDGSTFQGEVTSNLFTDADGFVKTSI